MIERSPYKLLESESVGNEFELIDAPMDRMVETLGLEIEGDQEQIASGGLLDRYLSGNVSEDGFALEIEDEVQDIYRLAVDDEPEVVEPKRLFELADDVRDSRFDLDRSVKEVVDEMFQDDLFQDTRMKVLVREVLKAKEYVAIHSRGVLLNMMGKDFKPSEELSPGGRDRKISESFRTARVQRFMTASTLAVGSVLLNSNASLHHLGDHQTVARYGIACMAIAGVNYLRIKTRDALKRR